MICEYYFKKNMIWLKSVNDFLDFEFCEDFVVFKLRILLLVLNVY